MPDWLKDVPMTSRRVGVGWDPVVARVILAGVAVPLGTILGAAVSVFPDPANPFSIFWIGPVGGVVGALAAWAGLLTGTIGDVLLNRTAIPTAVQLALVGIVSGSSSAGVVWACVSAMNIASPESLVVGTFLVASVLSATACFVLRWKATLRALG